MTTQPATYPHTLPLAPASLTPRQRDDARVEAGEAFVRALREGVEYEAARAVWSARLGGARGALRQG